MPHEFGVISRVVYLKARTSPHALWRRHHRVRTPAKKVIQPMQIGPTNWIHEECSGPLKVAIAYRRCILRRQSAHDMVRTAIHRASSRQTALVSCRCFDGRLMYVYEPAPPMANR